jgi:DNA-directed RNA polymerase II subunit RPB11
MFRTRLFRQLHQDPQVTFAGYKIPHPLEYQMLVKVQTRDASKLPVHAVKDALTQLTEEVDSMRDQFQKAAAPLQEDMYRRNGM